MALDEEHPIYGPFFGVMGAASAIIFSGKYCIRQPLDIDLSYDLAFGCMFNVQTIVAVKLIEVNEF